MPILIALSVAGGTVAFAAEAPAWQVNGTDSRIAFTATQQGGEFTGRFRRFDADVRFAADALSQSRIVVRIDVTSLDTGSTRRDRAVAGPDWFDFSQYPEARFTSDTISRAANGTFQANGKLTIKGTSRSVTVPLSWRREGDRASLGTHFTIDRTDFSVGEGRWATTDAVGRSVAIDATLSLRRQP
ncbi:MAG TPA: YceI family protein [Gammaproteobacteria bacterium]|nr:YceI family protein [Gammaproteobacteria bacterium]